MRLAARAIQSLLGHSTHEITRESYLYVGNYWSKREDQCSGFPSRAATGTRWCFDVCGTSLGRKFMTQVLPRSGKKMTVNFPACRVMEWVLEFAKSM